MTLQELDLSCPEKILFRLRSLYGSFGYARFKMNKFEEYDLYAGRKDFLLSDSVLTFTDGNGKLMALKPDVTLSIVKSSRDDPEGLQKLYYHESVYRAFNGGPYREQTQVGLECIGCIGTDVISEVLLLAARSLGTIQENAVLTISHLGLLTQVLEDLGLPAICRERALALMGEKNRHELTVLCQECGIGEKHIALLQTLVNLNGRPEAVLPRAMALLEGITDTAPLVRLMDTLQTLAGTAEYGLLRCDFSMAGDTRYYNGILFKGFLPGLPDSVLSGGQYDNLMRQMGRRSGAVGFAVYVDRLERMDAPLPAAQMLNVALPKGRLGEKVYAMFAKAGFECPAIEDPGRKLIFENPAKGIRYFWVKPSDVAIYVERGAADIGVVGKDILLEQEPEVYELLDLNIGKCRMAVAAMADFQDDPRKTLRVATKFENIAAGYYRSKGRDIDVIHLNGSIEIAPILGLSDVIVDIVETGKTLKENNLVVKETVVPISARLIANKAAYPFRGTQMDTLAARLAAQLED